MKTKLIKILTYILIVSVLAAMLLGLTGCKKPKDPTPSTEGSTATTEESVANTTEGSTSTEDANTTESIDATADATGNTEETGATQTTGPVCVHKLGGWVVDKPSTCTTEGSRHKECTQCKQTVEIEVIPTVDHTPGKWIEDKPATCTTQGTKHQECSQCKQKLLTITVTTAPHNEETIKGKPATATENGLTDGKKCKDCGAVTLNQYVIPATGSAGFKWEINADNKTCTINSLGTTTETAIAVPSAVAGYTVTGIGDNAFKDKTNIAAVSLPATITSIGKNAFSGCTALAKVTFQGTAAQWNAITKAENWNANTGAYTIYHQTGTIAK